MRLKSQLGLRFPKNLVYYLPEEITKNGVQKFSLGL